MRRATLDAAPSPPDPANQARTSSCVAAPGDGAPAREEGRERREVAAVRGHRVLAEAALVLDVVEELPDQRVLDPLPGASPAVHRAARGRYAAGAATRTRPSAMA